MKSGVMPMEVFKHLKKAFKLRNESDYAIPSRIRAFQVEEIISAAEDFL